MRRGRFISFEGGEGAGKTTQIRRLAKRLQPAVGEVVLPREPGGSLGAETLRELLVRGETDRWSPLAEALILAAARSDHLERLIRPALARGAWVLSDRFADSTRAYQGAAGGVAMGSLLALEALVLGDTRPELTLIFDLPVEEGLARADARGGADERFERKGRAFHERLRQGFLEIARSDPGRCVVLDATDGVEAIAEQVWGVVGERLLQPIA